MFLLQTSASAPWIGAQIRTEGKAVRVASVSSGSPAARAGIRTGDTVLAVSGRKAEPGFHLGNPDILDTWQAQSAALDQQDSGLARLRARGALELSLGTPAGRREVQVAFRPAGYPSVLARGWPLLLGAWSFALVAWILWLRRRDETMDVMLLISITACMTLQTIVPLHVRDLWLETSVFRLSLQANWFFGQVATLFLLNFALTFPTPLGILSRRPWIRWIAPALTAGEILLHLGRVLSNPLWTSYLLSTVSMAVALSIVASRLAFEQDPLRLRQVKWIVIALLAGLTPWLFLTALPSIWGAPLVPEQHTLLFLGTVPLFVGFAVQRIGLLQVGNVFDWITVHALMLALFATLEFALWGWLLRHFGKDPSTLATVLALELAVLAFLYAPVRDLLRQRLAHLSGIERPEPSRAQERLLTTFSRSGDPVAAFLDALEWSLKPRESRWFLPDQTPQLPVSEDPAPLLAAQLPPQAGVPVDALLVPLRLPEGTGCALLRPARQGWYRNDLRLVAMLARSAELLAESREAHRQRRETERLHRREREATLREMHDGVGSVLFGMAMLTENPPPDSDDATRQLLSDLHAGTQQALDSLRTGLSILAVPPEAFGPAMIGLLDRAERILASTGIRLETVLGDTFVALRLPTGLSFPLLRLLMEALSNAARHSGATTVRIEGEAHEGRLRLSVRDDGKGFDPALRGPGLGLDGMRRRIEELGGRFRLRTAPGQGTEIGLELSLEGRT